MTASDHSSSDDSSRVSAQVRGQAIWSAIAAVMMLWFGFKYPFINDTLPADLLNFTLRYGGIAMALSAVMLFSGWPTALMLDGVFAMIIGAALAGAGVLIVVSNREFGFQTLLFIVFGYLFFSSGLRNFKDYCRLGADATDAEPEPADSHAATAPPSESPRVASPRPGAAEPEVREPTPDGYLSSFADEDASDKPRE